MDVFCVNRKVRALDFEMPKAHLHEYWEVYYLVSGKCKMFVGHRLYYLETGDVLLIAPGNPHRATYPDQEHTERVTINFSVKALEPLRMACGSEVLDECLQRERISLPLAVRPVMEVILQKMEEEIKAGDGLSLFLARNRLYEIFALMLRHRMESNKKPVGATEDLVQQAAMHICRNFEKPLSLTDMAEMTHMTPTYFSRKFKQVTGFGFKEYLTLVRIAQAEKLLASSELSVTEIAMACGFGDSNYFGDSFKKIKGIAPRTYRKHAKLT